MLPVELVVLALEVDEIELEELELLIELRLEELGIELALVGSGSPPQALRDRSRLRANVL